MLATTKTKCRCGPDFGKGHVPVTCRNPKLYNRSNGWKGKKIPTAVTAASDHSTTGDIITTPIIVTNMPSVYVQRIHGASASNTSLSRPQKPWASRRWRTVGFTDIFSSRVPYAVRAVVLGA